MVKHAIFILTILGLLAVLIPLTIRESHHTKIVSYTYSGTIAIQTEGEYTLFKERVAQFNISLNAFQVLNTGYPILVHFGSGGSELLFSSPNAPELFPYGNPIPVKAHFGGFTGYLIAIGVIVAIFAFYILAASIGLFDKPYEA